MADLEVLSAHHERAVIAVGDDVLKIDTDDAHLAVEVEAMRLADGIPTPEVRWCRPPVLALARLPGVPLARPGEPVTTSPAAWEAAGSVVRRLHALALPPWPGWRVDDFAFHLDGWCRWLVDHDVVSMGALDRVVRIVQPALRPFPLVFTHGDLQAAHVFVDGDDVVGVIDWPDACRGDALFDLAVLTVGFEEQLDDVLRGYGTDVEREVIRGWWAFRRIAAVPWMVQHGFDATGDVTALLATA
jgi:aminoglycoside phosphotransferase (APT) family kinase protein